MKKLIPIFVAGAILATTSLGMAQENKAPKGAVKREAAIQQRVDRMTQDLNLKEDQKTKVKALFEAQDKKIQALRADTSLSDQQRQEKGRAIRDEQNKKLKEILTPEQFEKMQKQNEAKREQFKKRGGERQGGKKQQ